MSFKLFNPEREVYYFAESRLGEGGFGSVWSGYAEWGQQVAIKVTKPTTDVHRDFYSWLIDQHVHLLCWKHPHVVMTYDQFVSADGRLVIVMEKGGGSLQTLLGHGVTWTDKSICAIGAQILSALS